MTDLQDLRGLKERELIALGACVVCGKPLLATTDLTFYKLSIARAGFDAGAIKRRVGLQLALGSETLARAMGPDQDIAKVFDGPHEVVVHESCANQFMHLLELIPEPAGDGGL
jgi:hypothetical protein